MELQLEPIQLSLYQDYELINLTRKLTATLESYYDSNDTVGVLCSDTNEVVDQFETAVNQAVKSSLAVEISAFDLLRDRIFISFKMGLQFNLDHFNPAIRHSAELLQKLLTLVDNDLERLPLYEESEEVQKLEQLCLPETVQVALQRTRLDSHLSHLFELNRQTDRLVAEADGSVPYIKPLRVHIRKNIKLIADLVEFFCRIDNPSVEQCITDLNEVISVFNSNALARKKRMEQR